MKYTEYSSHIVTDTGLSIPKDPGNRDYQTYLESLPKEPEPELTPLEKAIAKRKESERK